MLAVGVLPSKAQVDHSLSAFSPYTMYGLGDLSVGGTAATRGMGGVGVALSNAYEFNYLNPASLSAIAQNSAIYNFSGVISNYYQKSDAGSNLYNSIDLQDLGFAIPIARGLGFGISLTPYSGVGYNTLVVNDNPSVVENIGRAVYSYYGLGGVSELSTSLGWSPLPGVSIGATMHYDFGSIDRHWNSAVIPVLNDETYAEINSVEALNINALRFSFGMQYRFRVGYEDNITIGATYALGKDLGIERTVYSSNLAASSFDTLAFEHHIQPLHMPQKFSGGIAYTNRHLTIGFDYSQQDWTGAFSVPGHITLHKIQDYRFGLSYTPDKMSMNSILSRMSYKAGFRYGTNYLAMNGHQGTEWTASLGFTIPLKAQNLSALNVAFEYGKRGAPGAILSEDHFRVVFGFSFFGADDLWFVKRQYD